MLSGLQVLAFLAFLATFSGYNQDLFDWNSWFEGAFFSLYLRLIPALSQMPQTGENYWARDSNPVGQASVSLPGGSTIQGSENPMTTAFYNIRYAQAPVGDLRFSDPVPYEQPNFQDASVRRKLICPQECTPPLCIGEISEDCLYLNVHVPSSYNFGSSEKLPVMVWVHGGGFFQGAGSDDLYNGVSLSNVTNTIVVTLNYRLGWLGFLPYEKEGISGNQGIKDQRMAMKWVYDNIEAFGGDQNQITLFGESAGAQSVLFHVLSEESAPYYQRAILQSTFAFPYQNKAEWNEITDLVLTQFKLRFKCNLLSGLDCLRKVPFEEYLALGNYSNYVAASLSGARRHFVPLKTESQMSALFEASTPMIDGVEFSANPLQMIADGDWASDKDIIIGHTNGEFNTFDFTPFTRESFEEKAQVIFGEYLGAAAVSAYQGFRPDGEFGGMFGDMMTHMYYACYARAIARKMSATTSGKVYFFEFGQVPEIRDPRTGELIGSKAQHAGELPYLFRNALPGWEMYRGTEGDKQVMEMMSDYWGSFARDGFPNSDNYSSWPQYNDQTNGRWNVLRIAAPDATIEDNLYEDECSFWDVSGVWDRS